MRKYALVEHQDHLTNTNTRRRASKNTYINCANEFLLHSQANQVEIYCHKTTNASAVFVFGLHWHCCRSSVLLIYFFFFISSCVCVHLFSISIACGYFSFLYRLFGLCNSVFNSNASRKMFAAHSHSPQREKRKMFQDEYTNEKRILLP